MYKSFDMIILTRSSKYKDYCVAGIDVSSGKPVRLITDNERTHGALTYGDLIMDNGCNASPLDVVHVNNVEYCPGPIQSENFKIKQGVCLRYLRSITTEEIMKYYSETSDKGVFNHREPVIQYRNAKSLNHSIEILRVQNLSVYTESKNGKNRTKADFDINGRRYKRYSVTDPHYYGNDGAVNSITNAIIICSIADDEWAVEHGYYVFVAGIHPINQGIKTNAALSGINQPKPKNAGKPWLPNDDDTLLALYNAGVSVGEIAKQFARTRGAIQARLVKHGIAENSFSVPEVIPKNTLNELIKKRK